MTTPTTTTIPTMTDLIADLRKEQAAVVALLEDPEATPEMLAAANDSAARAITAVQLGIKGMKDHPKLREAEARESHRKSLREMVGGIDALVADAGAQLEKCRAAGVE